jgi:hypothetical protein
MKTSPSVAFPRFWRVLSASAAIAAAGFWVGPGRWLAHAGSNDLPNAATLSLCAYFGVAWIAIFLVSGFVYRWKTLWQLPFAFRNCCMVEPVIE